MEMPEKMKWLMHRRGPWPLGRGFTVFVFTEIVMMFRFAVRYEGWKFWTESSGLGVHGA